MDEIAVTLGDLKRTHTLLLVTECSLYVDSRRYVAADVTKHNIQKGSVQIFKGKLILN